MKADILFKNGTVIDGTGAPRQCQDVAVVDDRIAATGDLTQWQASRVVDCFGLVVAPGFIDVHVHHDEEILRNPLMECAASQGVTTIINGNCGFSIAPLNATGPLPAPLNSILSSGMRFPRFRDYRERLTEEPAAVNSACLVGHGTLRLNALDDLNRPATASEISVMRRQLREALEDGALGMSSGTFYPLARAATTEELIEVSRELAPFGALYVTHMRDEGDHVVAALKETFEIGRGAGIGVHVSHHKCAGLANHGMSATTLPMIEAASRTQDVGLDTTPYVASATMLNSGRHRQASRVIVTWSEPYPGHAGRDLSAIAEEWGCDLDAAVERLLPALGIFFIMDENDVRNILRFPETIVCSDAIATGSHPHPRVWGTFPRVLGHYARNVGLFSLEEAVHKMTLKAASRFGLTGRGAIRAGNFADITVFDADGVTDTATYEKPVQSATGIKYVFVNGRAVYEKGRTTGNRPGAFLDGPTKPHP